jgi:hypothetical protein
MIEQKLIVARDPDTFDRIVNGHLREGSWIVVPNTHVVRENYFGIVVQRQEAPDKVFDDSETPSVLESLLQPPE